MAVYLAAAERKLGSCLSSVWLTDPHTCCQPKRQGTVCCCECQCAIMSDIQHVLQRERECACILKMHMGEVDETKLQSLRTALFLWELGISTSTLPSGINKEEGRESKSEDITRKLTACCLLATLERPFPKMSSFPKFHHCSLHSCSPHRWLSD